MFSVYLTWFTTTKSATLSHQLTGDTFLDFALGAGLLQCLAWQLCSSICSNIIKEAELRLNKWTAKLCRDLFASIKSIQTNILEVVAAQIY